MEDAMKYIKPTPSPKMKRERRLERTNYLLFVVVVLLVLGLIATNIAFIYRPSNQILIDYDTREIRGEYRTSSFRTTEEMINGGARFLGYYFSLNAGTIEKDTFIALMMLTKEKRNERRKAIKLSNHVMRVQAAKSKGRVEINDSATKVIAAKGTMLKVEYKGDIVIDSSTTLNNKRIPFHIILDLQMEGITRQNTSGVRVVDYHEYGVQDELK